MKPEEKHVLYFRSAPDREFKKRKTFSTYKAALTEGNKSLGYGRFLVESFQRNDDGKWEEFAPDPPTNAELQEILFYPLPS